MNNYLREGAIVRDGRKGRAEVRRNNDAAGV